MFFLSNKNCFLFFLVKFFLKQVEVGIYTVILHFYISTVSEIHRHLVVRIQGLHPCHGCSNLPGGNK